MSIFFICMIAAEDALALFGLLVLQHVGNLRGHDLPREAELVLQPAAGAFGAALGELAPEVVDLGLRVAEHLERHRLVELELRAAVERQELLALELELDGHHRAGRLAVDLLACVAVAADPSDLGILEDRDVVLGRGLAFVVEPQARHDLLFGNRHPVLLVIGVLVHAVVLANWSARSAARRSSVSAVPLSTPISSTAWRSSALR